MKILDVQTNKGFALLGVLIALLILASLGGGLAYYISSNQQSSILEISSKKAFYATIAGIEFAQKKLKPTELGGENINIATIAGTYEFRGTKFTIQGNAGMSVTVTGYYGNATESYTLDIPQSLGDCLIIDTTNAYIDVNGKDLQGITIERNSKICPINLILTGLKASWNPDQGQYLQQLKIDGGGPKEFHGHSQGLLSGEEANLTNPYTLNRDGKITIDYFKWKTGGNNKLTAPIDINLEFILSDGSRVPFGCEFN